MEANGTLNDESDLADAPTMSGRAEHLDEQRNEDS
jgi:hypothetical protein